MTDRLDQDGARGSATGLSSLTGPASGSGPSGFDPSRFGKRCPDGDRPAREPGGLECQRCQCIFIGEEWHQFCEICVAIVAREIAASQGDLVMREPDYSSDSDGSPQGGDACGSVEDDSAGRQASPEISREAASKARADGGDRG